MKSCLPSVSIIVPCYDCEKWIGRCLSAIEDQTYQGPIEVLCVDDHSHDMTPHVIRSFAKTAKTRIVLISNTENLGPAESRNKALEICSGHWIGFCDADDWYDRDFLAKMIQKGSTDNADVVMCHYAKVFESSRKTVIVDYLADVSINDPVKKIMVYSKASLWLLLVRRHIMEGITIPDLRNGEDIAVVPIIQSRAGRLGIVRDPLYNYYIRASSQSHAVSKKALDYLCRAYQYIYDNLSNEYDDVREFLGIRTVLYGATLNGFKSGNKDHEILRRVEQFEELFPSWHSNPYMSLLSTPKRVYLALIRSRSLRICRMLARMHRRVSTVW